MKRLRWILVGGLSLAAGFPAFPSLLAQNASAPDIIRGRVFGPDSEPVAGAHVTVRVTASRETRETRTNDRGSYTVLFPGGVGDYVVTVRAVGLVPATIRVVRQGDDTGVLLGNVTLGASQSAPQLDEVKIRGVPRPQLSRTEQLAESEAWLDPTNDLPGAPRSDWWAPLDPKHYSVLGTDPSENTLTVNGAKVSTIVPNPVGIDARVVTNTGEANQGGYSGGNFNLLVRGGGDYHLRILDVAASPSSWQWVDEPSEDAGNRGSVVSANLWMFDPLFSKRLNQTSTFTVTQRTSALPQLPTTTEGFARLGVAPDSIQRFLDVLRTLGIPITVAGVPARQRSTQLAWLSRIDIGRDANTNVQLVMNAGRATQQGIGTSPASLPSSGGESRQTGAFVTATVSRYLGNGFLTDITTTINRYVTRANPYLQVPNGRVQITSVVAPDDSVITWLNFGGNPNVSDASRMTNVETRASTSWFSLDSRHRYRIGGTARQEHLSTNTPMNSLGSFEFQSLQELEGGIATRFTRETNTESRRATGTHFDLYVDDSWKARQNLSVQYGLRFDLDRVSTPARYNPAIDSLFGQRTDVLPRLSSVSPRLGFSWRPSALRGGMLSLTTGRFQSSLNAATVSGTAQSTGLPASTQLLDCVGPTAPLQDWNEYRSDPTTIPRTCADGTNGEPGAITSPQVLVFDRAYRPPVQWRTTLLWNNTRWTSFRMAITFSRGTAQRSQIDLNLRPTPQFTLAAEANRPVYVPDDAIVPATGAISTYSSRLDARYGSVFTTVSDLHSQLTHIMLSKLMMPSAWQTVYVQYAYQTGRNQARGFDAGGTAGNPFVPVWGRADVIRHAVRASSSTNIGTHLRVMASMWTQSGIPYTPHVAGDVNGDGLANDIAFIPHSSTETDVTMRNAMTALLRRTSSSARRCLTAQYDRVASRNSCAGPWSTGLDLQLEITPPRFPSEAGITVDVANAAGALDQLFHGNAHRRGWGELQSVDPVLMVVNGFDPATRRFEYSVNSRFGQRGAFGAWHTPTELRVRVRFPLGASLTTQQNRTTARAIRSAKDDRRILERGLIVGRPFAALRQWQDSLQFTKSQDHAITEAAKGWQLAIDSVRTSLADYVEQVTDTVPDREVATYVRKTYERIAAITRYWGHVVGLQLTPDQVARLPVALRQWVTGRADDPL